LPFTIGGVESTSVANSIPISGIANSASKQMHTPSHYHTWKNTAYDLWQVSCFRYHSKFWQQAEHKSTVTTKLESQLLATICHFPCCAV
jgi:hypothetical protein